MQKKVQLWINKELHDRLSAIAEHGEITIWATEGLERGVAKREEELIESARRQNLLRNISTERAS